MQSPRFYCSSELSKAYSGDIVGDKADSQLITTGQAVQNLEEEAKQKQLEQAAARRAEEEMRRQRAEEEAKRKQSEQAAARRAEEEMRRQHAEEEAKRKQSEQAAAPRTEEEMRRQHAEEEAKRKQSEQAAAPRTEEERARIIRMGVVLGSIVCAAAVCLTILWFTTGYLHRSSSTSKTAPSNLSEAAGDNPTGTPVGVIGGTPDGTGSRPPIVKAAPPKKLSISSRVMAGYLLEKTAPEYPPIAKAARIQGTVVLQATISKTGSIENLRVVSGPPMLQQAALDAVRSWRYKPYLLNGDPVEVETTVNVVFNLGG